MQAAAGPQADESQRGVALEVAAGQGYASEGEPDEDDYGSDSSSDSVGDRREFGIHQCLPCEPPEEEADEEDAAVYAYLRQVRCARLQGVWCRATASGGERLLPAAAARAASLHPCHDLRLATGPPPWPPQGPSAEAATSGVSGGAAAPADCGGRGERPAARQPHLVQPLPCCRPRACAV